MIAKQLERELYLHLGRAEFGNTGYQDIEARLNSLRAYGLLHKGRENRALALSDEQIADAILALCTRHPGWAGHAAICLKSLRPAGGPRNTPSGAQTLSHLIQILLNDLPEDIDVARLSISEAEDGPNTNGFATLYWRQNGIPRITGFVSQYAVSLLSEGAENRHNPERRDAPISFEYTFSGRFFSDLGRRIRGARAKPTPYSGNGSEYDTAEAEEARRKRLGCRPGSSFLNLPVTTHTIWPTEETLIRFQNKTLVLLPQTRENTASLHIDLATNRMSAEDARTLMNQFLSLLVFVEDQYAALGDGWSGNPVPVPISKSHIGPSRALYWIFDKSLPENPKARLALGIYREALNAEKSGLPGAAVLNYYRIIELLNPDGQQGWIDTTLTSPTDLQIEASDWSDFIQACTDKGQTFGKYLFKANRCATAHAKTVTSAFNPDDAHDARRLYVSIPILHALARRILNTHYEISDSPVDQ